MNIEETTFVRKCDARPAGKPDECFYCREPMGAAHKADCVIPQRSVVVTITITAVVSRPRSWSDDSIESHFNESSYCMNNLLDDLGAWPAADEESCACGHTDVRVVREATEADHEGMPNLMKVHAIRDAECEDCQ